MSRPRRRYSGDRSAAGNRPAQPGVASSAAEPDRRRRRRRRLLLVLLAAVRARGAELAEGAVPLRRRAARVEVIQRAVTERLSTVEYARGVLTPAPSWWSATNFARFVEPLLDEHARNRGSGMGASYPGRATPRLTSSSPATRASPSTRSPSGMSSGQFVPAGTRAEYWPILFIEPSGKK